MRGARLVDWLVAVGRFETAKTEIGARHVRSRLPEMLREVRAGRCFTMIDRGEAIADLLPSATGMLGDAAAAIDRFRAFMREDPLNARRRVDLRILVDEDRE